MAVNESLRLVDFTVGGRPFGVLDLEDGVFLSKVKGTMQVRPGQRTVSQARLPGRYGGTRATDAREENAELAWTCAVVATSEDQALTKAGDLLAKLADMSVGRMVEFRPRGATYPTFLDIRGPGVANPVYDADLLEQQNAFLVELAVPVAPLGEMHRLDVFDDFSVDSLADYTDDGGKANLSVTGGQLQGNGTAAGLLHSARGHLLVDSQQTLKLTTGAAVSQDIRLKARIVGPIDFLYLRWQGTTLSLNDRNSGAPTVLASAAWAAAANTTYWVRFRLEGAVLVAEGFTAAPTPMATPAATATFTLTGATLTKYGNAASLVGPNLAAYAADYRFDDYRIEPYTYRNQTLPKQIALGGSVPGDAPALVDVHVTPSGGAAPPVWALVGWTERPSTPLASSVTPIGIIEAETAVALSQWAVTADVDYRGGSGVQLTAAGELESFAEWRVDPSTLVADDFTQGEVEIEVWARVELAATLTTPRLTISAYPSAGVNYGVSRYSAEFGTAGRFVVEPSSGTVFRLVRLGTLSFYVDRLRPVAWLLRLAGAVLAGSTGVFGVDQLLLVRVAGRAVSGPTGRVLDNDYPKFAATTAQLTRIWRSDGAGFTVEPGGNPFPSYGGAGAPLEFRPGAVDVLVALSSLVPDDPTASTATEQEDYSASVHFGVTPRVRLLRGA